MPRSLFDPPPAIGVPQRIDLGFTGTADKTTPIQLRRFRELMRHLRKHKLMVRFHHGDCIEADEQAHHIIREFTGWLIHVYPPTNPAKRAYCKGDMVHAETDYLTRNHHIVEAADWMVAMPKGVEILHSGTWSTVRYARKLGRFIVFIHPDGSYSTEGKRMPDEMHDFPGITA